MKKFKLCYEIEHDTPLLIPDLLPKEEPFTGKWNDVLAFQYHYNVLPTFIISRFSVRMNAFLLKTVWRSGVVRKNGGNAAADIEERKIHKRSSPCPRRNATYPSVSSRNHRLISRNKRKRLCEKGWPEY